MTTHDDLQRDMGRVEGTLDAMETRLGKLETLVSEGFEKLNKRLDHIDQRESERRGAWKTLLTAASLIGGAVGWILTKLFH